MTTTLCCTFLVSWWMSSLDFSSFYSSFFSFLFFSRFPDSGLKMKRKSYCLITTAVTSIKCYLKVNGLHMLKTLELLTDHCKVSRIFNNLHGMHSPAMFGAGRAASPGSLHPTLSRNHCCIPHSSAKMGLGRWSLALRAPQLDTSPSGSGRVKRTRVDTGLLF